jgi:hypothetical protein
MATFIDSERSAKKLAFEGHIYLKHTNPALRGDPLEYMKICSRFVKYNNGPEEEEEEEQQ